MNNMNYLKSDQKKMEKLDSKLDEGNALSYIEDDFQTKDYDKKEQLRHIRELEEQRNLQEQKEIELERIQKQIVNKLNITDKSENKIKCSETEKPQTKVKPNRKQNEIQKFSNKTENIPQKNHKTMRESYKFVPSSHSNRSLSYDHYKGTSYWKDDFHNLHQRRPHRAARGRYSSFRWYHKREQNQNRSCIDDSQHELDFNEKQKIDHMEYKIEEYSKFEFPSELVPANVEEEEEMLKEAIELSKQQMFIEKLEKREIDKTIEETTRNQEECVNAEKKSQKQFNNINNRTVCRYSKNTSRPLFSNLPDDSEMKQGVKHKQEKNDHSVTNFLENNNLAYSNKIQKNGSSSNKQSISVTANRNSHHRQGTKNKHFCHTYKNSLDSYKENSGFQTETVTSVPNFVEPSRETYSDPNSSSWKESARKNLKQLLRLDSSPEASVGIANMATTTKLLEANIVHCDTVNIGSNNGNYETHLGENDNFYKRENCKEKLSGRCSTKQNGSSIQDDNNYNIPVKCNDCFQNYSTRRGGNRSRLHERRYLRIPNISRLNNDTNECESACVNWKPYPKLVGDRRTDSIPPRFRKNYQQIIS